MKRQIRQSIFETNSSSTHTITISTTDEYKDVKLEDNVIGFNAGEFGWEFDEYDSVDDKASYLWTGIVKSDYFTPEQIKKIKENIKNVLSEYGFSAWFQTYEVCSYELSDGDTRTYCNFPSGGYVDHAYDLCDWFCELFPNEGEDINGEMLMQYLFNPGSYIETGNDNSDYVMNSRHEDDTCPTISFFKDN